MRRMIVLVAILVAALLGVPMSAQAAPGSAGLRYVALGDSYSSGVGASPYDPASGACARSARSYAPLFAAEHRTSFTFAACSGAKTADVLATQIGALNASTDLVTITIGGNDIGFSKVLGTCTLSSTDSGCATAVDVAEASAVTVLSARLVHTYAAIRHAAPNARVTVLGYPRLFETTANCTEPGVPNLTRRIKLNQGDDLLNRVTRTISHLFGFTFVDVRNAFAGHSLCSADPWIHTPTVPTIIGPYHPTPTGYQAYLRALDRTQTAN